MTIFELVRAFEKSLIRARMPCAHLDAEVLVACALNTDRSHVLAHGLETAPPPAMRRAKTLLKRRLKHEPIAYIRGWQMFYGRQFAVNRRTLIPRPETELIIEKLLAEMPHRWRGTFIDIGTGSGAIAITLACEFPHARVIALDVSQSALTVARKNARFHGLAHPITFLHGTLLEPLTKKFLRRKQPLVMVANLPYVPTKIWQRTDPQVRMYEPRKALDGGADGLTIYRALLRHIKKTGIMPATLWLEIDTSQSRSLPAAISKLFPRAKHTIYKDLGGRARLIRVVF